MPRHPLHLRLTADHSPTHGGPIDYEDAFSKTYLVNVAPGVNHTFQVRAHREDGASTNGFVDADIVVEHRGWTCNVIVLPLDVQ